MVDGLVIYAYLCNAFETNHNPMFVKNLKYLGTALLVAGNSMTPAARVSM